MKKSWGSGLVWLNSGRVLCRACFRAVTFFRKGKILVLGRCGVGNVGCSHLIFLILSLPKEVDSK